MELFGDFWSHFNYSNGKASFAIMTANILHLLHRCYNIIQPAKGPNGSMYWCLLCKKILLAIHHPQSRWFLSCSEALYFVVQYNMIFNIKRESSLLLCLWPLKGKKRLKTSKNNIKSELESPNSKMIIFFSPSTCLDVSFATVRL